ncbi:hypothetical protein CALVIDRAFT_600513, partial [Calocera viscosa TUFC12733]
MDDGTTVVRIHEAQEFRNARGQFWRRSYTALHEVHSHPKVNTILKVAGAHMAGWDAYHEMVNTALKEWNNCQGKGFNFDDPRGTRDDVISLLRMFENEDRQLMFSAEELAEILAKYEELADSSPGRCYSVFQLFRSSGTDREPSSSDSLSVASTSSSLQPASMYYKAPYRQTLYLVVLDCPSHVEANNELGMTWAIAYPDNDG